jgi:tetratricopeptide (TPR) repeat protein
MSIFSDAAVGDVDGVPTKGFESVSRLTPYLLLAFLAVLCFSVATHLQPHASSWSQHGQDSMMKVLLGDGRRLLANHLFTKADVYFHSGYYPTIFDGAAPQENHMAGHQHEAEKHEENEDFMGKPRNWVDAFGRNFKITQHTHLEHGREREILPWLKFSAEMDPHLIDTYTVAAYWLANHLHKIPEAEQFLREGLRENPNSYEILFALGRIYYNNYHDAPRARNVWELALKRWREREAGKKEPDKFGLEEIVVNLGRLEEDQGNLTAAIKYLEAAKEVSPAPQSLQKQIDELKRKLEPNPQASR